MTSATCAFAVVAGWLLVAALVDAQHPASVVAFINPGGTATGSVPWWSIAAGMSWRAGFALVLAVAAAWLQTREQPPSRTLSVALLLAAVTAMALAGVGAGGLLGMLSTHGPIAEPTTLVAVAGFDVAAGTSLTAVIFSLAYGAAGTSADVGNRRLLPLPVATVGLLLAASGLVLGLAEAAGGLDPRIVAATSMTARLSPPSSVIQLGPADGSSGSAFRIQPDPSSTLAARVAARLPGGVVSEPDGCQDESADVPGAHAPHGCEPLAYVQFAPSDHTTGQAFVDAYVDTRELRYQYDVELRYMRQYSGNRLDAGLPGVNNARMIHTGEEGDLFAVVARVGSRLVIEFVSSDDGHPLTGSDITSATKDAHAIIDAVRAH